MVNGNGGSHGVALEGIIILGNTNSYKDANQLELRLFGTDVSGKSEKVAYITIYPFCKNDTDNKNSIVSEKTEDIITENFAYKSNKSFVSLCSLYKGIFVQRDGTVSSASLETGRSSNCSGDPESNVTIFSIGYSSQPNGTYVFPNNFEKNRNCTETEERERIIKIAPTTENNSGAKSYVLVEGIFVQHGGRSSSLSLEIGIASFSNGASETNVTRFTIQYTWQPNESSLEILPRNSGHSFDNVNYFNNINETGFEKSGVESFHIFALLLDRIAIIIEVYSDCLTLKSNKKSNNGPTKFQLVVVSSELFEEAMRQCHIETVELTYTNVFPSDCRMFIGVPIYKHGYIHRKDQL
ncbi:uncharacterized protein LOC123552297 [Mercenaria mercenaria]|uniref:uncharacterized protein LOC123552297 n=1 Tax=Mercenaria mercenaria TaxID=6596 RepID=UPI00234F13D6|nr:uncharacterized protein LOC123552297 [Mercenaria mercenaria]